MLPPRDTSNTPAEEEKPVKYRLFFFTYHQRRLGSGRKRLRQSLQPLLHGISRPFFLRATVTQLWPGQNISGMDAS